ncbi:hypothetical protein REISMN_05115 [Rickettsia tamurae subsp. buchneri]|uniref:Uncharacterized protein n=1 Tax=Rickettsia tamurae subsp. buchneri TaxID=1462938 RepID=A0A8E0WLE1_9RICK|nr:hypothetical protein REISMN_05115 [Rickettsia tamurae subsp. buchneri]
MTITVLYNIKKSQLGIFQVLSTLLYFCGGVAAWVLNRHCEQALLRGPVKPTVSPRGQATG